MLGEYAKVSAAGDVVCPTCKTNIITPAEINPATDRLERFILVPEESATCPYCMSFYKVNPEEAEKHNAYWLKHERTRAEG